FLFPRGLAAEADATALNIARTKNEAKEHHAAEALAAARALADKVQDKTVSIKAKGGASGRLFGKVTAKDVAENLSRLVGTEIDKRKVELDRDIKDFGTYNAAVKLHAGVTAAFKVKVEEL
ncbi:50S ribosomal protein L9, partial [gut metagenome]